MAGAEGIEPTTAVLETDVIPLHHAPRESRKMLRASFIKLSRASLG